MAPGGFVQCLCYLCVGDELAINEHRTFLSSITGELVLRATRRLKSGMLRGVYGPLVLASGSPRRRELLAQAGLNFEVAPSQVSELATTSLSMAELTTYNATRKAVDIARLRRDAVVLGADTLVSLEGKTIGKPADWREALQILQRLRGREHQICTAVFLFAPRRKLAISFYVISHVRFRPLNDTQIRAYLAKVNPLDKAGAYAAQRDGAEIIAEIRGSYTNVVGLPMDETIRALRKFGIKPAARTPRDQSAGSRQQISSLLPSGSSKKNA